MEITFIQITKDELIEIINQAVRAAMPKEIREYKREPFIKGIHELAKFMNLSVSRAQKLKNESIIPYWQDGRTVLLDPDKVKAAMTEEKYIKKRRK